MWYQKKQLLNKRWIEMKSWRFQKSKQKWWRQFTHGHLIESPLWLMYMWNWHAIICNFTPRGCVNDWSNGSIRSCCIWGSRIGFRIDMCTIFGNHACVGMYLRELLAPSSFSLSSWLDKHILFTSKETFFFAFILCYTVKQINQNFLNNQNE